jgi:prevent-host-death family protein
MTERELKHVTTAEARQRMSELLNRAAYGGERFAVTRHGKEVVAIVPHREAALLDRIRELLEAREYEAALEEIRASGTVPWDEVRRDLDL